MDDTVRILRHTLPDHLTLDVDNLERPMKVVSDRGGIEQLLLNLVSNARDASPVGGTVHLGIAVAGDTLTIRVRDDGAGMDDDTLSRLFEPFYTTKGAGRGSGLGMATVRALVEQMDGTIDVTSHVGAGTDVTVCLPVEPLPDEVVDKARPAGAALRILWVDDDEKVREITERALRAAGHSVMSAGDGAEALEIVGRGESFDAVVSDMVMPRLTGLELARAVASRSPDTAVLIVSGHPRVSALPESVGFLQKPFSVDQLLRGVRAAVATRRDAATAGSEQRV